MATAFGEKPDQGVLHGHLNRLAYLNDYPVDFKTSQARFLTAQGDNSPFWSNAQKNWSSYTAASSNFTAPFDGIFRFYAFGAGGKSFCVAGTTANSGAGGGCAYGDIYMTAGQVATITISSGITTVTIGGVVMLTANNGSDATVSTGGIGGTATKHTSVLNGGAFSGSNGTASTNGASGGIAGNPLGVVKTQANNLSIGALGGVGVVADADNGASGNSREGRYIYNRFTDPLFLTCVSPLQENTSSTYAIWSADGAGAATTVSTIGNHGGFMGGGGSGSVANGNGGFASCGGFNAGAVAGQSGYGAGASASKFSTVNANGGGAICLIYY
jgi:hypothetical protein